MKLGLYKKPKDGWCVKLPKSKEHPRHWITTTDLEITLSNNNIINIPKGYVWDGASIPKVLWKLFPNVELDAPCFLIHDFLYTDKENQLKQFDYNIYKTRKFADVEMKMWGIKQDPKIKLTIFLFYKIIRWVGGFFYSRQLQLIN